MFSRKCSQKIRTRTLALSGSPIRQRRSSSPGGPVSPSGPRTEAAQFPSPAAECSARTVQLVKRGLGGGEAMTSQTADVALLCPLSPHSHVQDCWLVLKTWQKVEPKVQQPITAQRQLSELINMKSVGSEDSCYSVITRQPPCRKARTLWYLKRSELFLLTLCNCLLSKTEQGEALCTCKQSAHRMHM